MSWLQILSYLKLMIDTEICSYCKERPEKIHHLFLTCPKVKLFLDPLEIFLNEYLHEAMFLVHSKIQLGFKSYNPT